MKAQLSGAAGLHGKGLQPAVRVLLANGRGPGHLGWLGGWAQSGKRSERKRRSVLQGGWRALSLVLTAGDRGRALRPAGPTCQVARGRVRTGTPVLAPHSWPLEAMSLREDRCWPRVWREQEEWISAANPFREMGCEATCLSS